MRSPLVKIGISRQVVIPKKIHRELRLEPGDYLAVELRKGRVIMTPKVITDKELDRRLTAGLEDIRRGRGIGPFKTARDAIRALKNISRKQ